MKRYLLYILLLITTAPLLAQDSAYTKEALLKLFKIKSVQEVPFLAGRTATLDDVLKKRAAYMAMGVDDNGKPVQSNPVDLPLPFFALKADDLTQTNYPVLVVQAERSTAMPGIVVATRDAMGHVKVDMMHNLRVMYFDEEPVWKNYTLDEHIVAAFPFVPTFSDPEITPQTFGVRCNKGFFMVSCVEIGNIIRDDDSSGVLKQFYTQIMQGSLDVLKAKVLKTEAFDIGKYKGFEYTSAYIDPATQQSTERTSRLLKIGGKVYFFTFLPSSPKDGDAAATQKKFFESVSVTK